MCVCVGGGGGGSERGERVSTIIHVISALVTCSLTMCVI